MDKSVVSPSFDSRVHSWSYAA